MDVYREDAGECLVTHFVKVPAPNQSCLLLKSKCQLLQQIDRERRERLSADVRREYEGNPLAPLPAVAVRSCCVADDWSTGHHPDAAVRACIYVCVCVLVQKVFLKILQ